MAYRIDYVLQMNAFYGQKTAIGLDADATALYLELFQRNNSCGWTESFKATNKAIMGNVGLSEAAFYRSRANLIDAGFITYEKCKVCNGIEGGLYSLVILYQVEVLPKRKERPAATASDGYLADLQNSADSESAKPGYIEYINTSERERQSPPVADLVSPAKAKFQKAFPNRSTDGVRFIPTDYDIDDMIEKIQESEWLMSRPASVGMLWFLSHYVRISTDYYKKWPQEAPAFNHPRAGPGGGQKVQPYIDKRYSEEELNELYDPLDIEM